MRKILVIIPLILMLVSCASQAVRKTDTVFVVDTPTGRMTGKVEQRETTNTTSGPDTSAIASGASSILDGAIPIIGTIAPWAGAAGLALAALLKHLQAKKAEDERDTALGTVVSTTKAVSRFAEEDDAPAKRLKELLSQEMDRDQKALVREVKP